MRAVFAFWLIAGLVMAQEMDCLTPKTQVELTVCAGQDWMAADTDLNDA